jgi:hypothetical protein
MRSRIMTTDHTPPRINGRDLEVFPIDGPHGSFEVGYAGSNSEGERTFFYRDERGRFFFSAEFLTKPRTSWDINGATRAGTADPLKTSAGNAAVFQQNIEFFLTTRDWSSPGQTADASIAGRPVRFSWNIEQ